MIGTGSGERAKTTRLKEDRMTKGLPNINARPLHQQTHIHTVTHCPSNGGGGPACTVARLTSFLAQVSISWDRERAGGAGEWDWEGGGGEGGNRLPDRCVAEQRGLWHCHHCCFCCCCCQMTTGQRKKQRKTREGRVREDSTDWKDYQNSLFLFK